MYACRVDTRKEDSSRQNLLVFVAPETSTSLVSRHSGQNLHNLLYRLVFGKHILQVETPFPKSRPFGTGIKSNRDRILFAFPAQEGCRTLLLIAARLH